MPDQPDFFAHPIINSPYACPQRHWELDESGQPTQQIKATRRSAQFITPIPKPKKGGDRQQVMLPKDGISTQEQEYDPTPIINHVRQLVSIWRSLPESAWNVTPETSRLLRHWRTYDFPGLRPFFCQIEAVETIIWLHEVAPGTKEGKRIIELLKQVNDAANPGLVRTALKLATGAGKTTVMAMLIAWQTVNAVRRPSSKNYSRGFLVITPGITIKDRLQILQPNHPDNYYTNRQLVPQDLLPEVMQAKIVITNFHAFKLRERLDLSSGGRALLQGRTGQPINTLETEGQMLQRVIPDLMALKQVMVLNDEAHHCYRERPADASEETIEDEDKEQANHNRWAARLWISGIESLSSRMQTRVIDLSATPFFLAGSGYKEGTIFPWTISDFSLMDAIECGIVKLPRVPVAENIPGGDMPVYRDLWENIRKDMPKTGRVKAGTLDPQMLPTKLQTAINALYGHYARTFELWQECKIPVPPCFIIVCQNTTISKLVYDYVSGYHITQADGTTILRNGNLPLFRNYDEGTGDPFPRPNTILVDSEELESGESLDQAFRAVASDEIERFRRQIIEQTNDPRAADTIDDARLLREVLNTVGKAGQLGAGIRCVVSVSMLTEGWDASNVTHILGIRAFGTQLLCEQVIGRALRRQSYEVEADGLLLPEYADIFGIPFDFTGKPAPATPQKPRESVLVQAVRPFRDHLAIRFPRVEGYRVDLPEDDIQADFNDDSILELTPDLVGPTLTRNQGIIGQGVDITLEKLDSVRQSEITFRIAHFLIEKQWRTEGEAVNMNLFPALLRVTRQWFETCLICSGGTKPAQLLYQQFAEMAANRITAAITRAELERGTPGQPPGKIVKAVLDPYNPTGSTATVRFMTTRTLRWETSGPPPKNHVNYVICDSDWEAEFCRIAESHPRVIAYTKNHSLGFEVPYQYGPEIRHYRPDFIVLVDDGQGPDDPLHLIVEIKGFRREDAKEKRATMETLWVPGVNNLGTWGRWAFAEFGDIWEMQDDFAARLEIEFSKMLACSGRLEDAKE